MIWNARIASWPGWGIGRAAFAKDADAPDSLVPVLSCPSGLMRELQLHFAVADYLRRVLPAYIPWTHFPSGELRDKRTAAKLKHMGLAKGWPDFIVLTNPVIFIELKSDKGRMSQSQKDFAVLAQEAGHRYFVARDLPTIESALQKFGVKLAGVLA